MPARRSRDEVVAALGLIGLGGNVCDVARRTGIPRSTLRYWQSRPLRVPRDSGCPICSKAPLDPEAYSYLLGLYLGDGHLARHRRGVFRLRIFLDARYPGIVSECAGGMTVVSNGRCVSRQDGAGCAIVGCYWKHWPCLLPHGPGPKHLRGIRLAPWQEALARAYPAKLVRGLIQSDGCRILNRVGEKVYPRYFFSNRSADIHAVFCQACDDLDIAWTRSSWKEVSIARAADVAKLDLLVGPKR
jgi:hypothetical protein